MLRELAYLIRQDLVDLKEGICGLFKGGKEAVSFVAYCDQDKEVICDPEELLP